MWPALWPATKQNGHCGAGWGFGRSSVGVAACRDAKLQIADPSGPDAARADIPSPTLVMKTWIAREYARQIASRALDRRDRMNFRRLGINSNHSRCRPRARTTSAPGYHRLDQPYDLPGVTDMYMQMAMFRRYSMGMLLVLDVYRNHHEPPMTNASLGNNVVRKALHRLGFAA